jgi:hypothetical protein
MKDKNKVPYLAFAVFFSLFVLISVLLIKPIVVRCAKEKIKKTLGADEVFIGDCHLKFFHSISFYDVQVHKGKVFDITAKEFSVQFNPWLMILGFSPDHFIEELHLSNLALKSSDFELENGTLTINQKTSGLLLIDKIQLGRLIMYKIKSVVRLENQKLFFKPLTGQMLNGLMDGEISTILEKEPAYTARFNFNDIDLRNFVVAFELSKKVRIEGLLAGNLILDGKGKKVKILNGNLSSSRQGGIVIIKDVDFLKRFAAQSNQHADLVIESLKNYHYNVGDINLLMDQGAAALEIHLNGETGKRDFQIRLHNFF